MAPVILAGPENLQSWLNDLTRRARRGGCYQMLFPSPSSSTHLGRPHNRHHHHGHRRGGAPPRDSIPGHLWAYMLTLVGAAGDAPVTDREWNRLRSGYLGAKPGDYPSRAHFEQGQEWLDTVTKRYTRVVYGVDLG